MEGLATGGSRHHIRLWLWIPGSALRAAPE